jgi:hypothetical protein
VVGKAKEDEGVNSSERIKIVADYFTGPLVAENSMKLGIPSHVASAKEWFEVRRISGYMDSVEAD